SCAAAGDALSHELIAEAGHYLGIAVANLLNLFNPARVVIGGRLAEAGDHLFVPLRRTVRDRALWTSIERADVVTAQLGDEQEAVGAATLVLRAALDDLSLFQAASPNGVAPAAILRWAANES
ncbi:MAG: ROK family protein, partial [Chloroflexota bacterium]|nr:ROK family protein [Chloroflexota bacterium]